MPDSVLPKTSYRIVVVGDIHNQWSGHDEQALSHLRADLVLFVGDFGNESLDIVGQIAQLPIPKAIAYGNHDAWYTATPWGQKRCPYDRHTDNWFQQQWDLLEPFQVGYRALDFPELQLSVVGGRPFSWGGPKWFPKEFYREWFDVTSEEDSCDRILSAIQSAQYDHVILLSHNGPTGLGDTPESTCGKDWEPRGGDFGDPDLRGAIAASPDKNISLVTFGHMHHTLRHRKDRLRERLVTDDRAIYLNAAVVPRVRVNDEDSAHQFSVIDFQGAQIQTIQSIWIMPNGQVTSKEVLFTSQAKPLPLST
ncbi:MAG: TIGR04168 family protein [Acaryochloridaceae cyanobacterium RL_2_7]|nr:TIGR04168 family protein [Acaryochloridaceae cyanobacterium RL_2_7]